MSERVLIALLVAAMLLCCLVALAELAAVITRLTPQIALGSG